MKRGQITIPKSELGQKLDQIAAIKVEMTSLLRQLEEAASGKKIDKVGTWRHDPLGWIKKNKPNA
jgi:hypothetical protein